MKCINGREHRQNPKRQAPRIDRHPLVGKAGGVRGDNGIRLLWHRGQLQWR